MFDKQVLVNTLVRNHAVIHENIKLSSGKISGYYYDLRSILLDPSFLFSIDAILIDEISATFGSVKSVGGLETSAIPIVAALVLRGFHWLYVRKQPKPFGISRMVSGRIVEPVVIIDDVLTTGASIKKVIDAVKAEGHEVKGVMTIIDREDEGSKELKKKVKCYSLLKHSDFENH
jgi:orotate phosphoribosyltransferase